MNYIVTVTYYVRINKKSFFKESKSAPKKIQSADDPDSIYCKFMKTLEDLEGNVKY